MSKPFSKVSIGTPFRYNGNLFRKSCAVSGETATMVQIFEGNEVVETA
jgi:hypothetical protein